MLEVLSKVGQKVADLIKISTPIDPVLSEEKIYQESNNYFQRELPFREWDHAYQLYIQENSKGFVLEVLPLLGCNPFLEKELSILCSEIGSEGDSIQCLLLADHRIQPQLKTWAVPRNLREGIYTKITEHKKTFFEKYLRSGECPPPRDFRILFSYSSKTATKEALSLKKSKALSFFNRMSFAHDLEPQKFLEALSGIVNYSGETEVFSRHFNPFNYIANNLCLPGSIELKRDHVKFYHEGNVNHFKAFEVLEYPEEWTLLNNQSFLGDFFQQSRGIFADFFLHYGIYFPKQGGLTSKLKTKQKTLEQQLKFKAMRKLFSTAQRESDEIQFSMKEIHEGQQFVQTRMTIGLFSKPDHFMDVEGSLRSTFSRLGFKISPCDSIHLDEFVRCLPMTWGESDKQRELQFFRAFKTTTTHEVGLFMPLLAEWAGNSKTGMPLLGRRGQFLTWDPFETQGNLNTVVVGASGTGKSVFMQEMIMSHLGTSGRVFVLDLGRSFEKLCLLLKGQYLFFNKESNLNLNPFTLIPESSDTEAVETALNMVSSIVSTMAMPMEKIDGDRSNMIHIAVKKAWRENRYQAVIDDVCLALESSTYETERMKGNAESLIDSLQKYTTTGEYKQFFYGENRLEIKKEFVVIETEELKNLGDLQAVILQIFSLIISTEVFMGDRKIKSLICIDEAWDLLKSPQMEGFIESMARRLRKYNGALLVGTQSLKDFERSPGAGAAFQNSNWLVMLGKDGNTIPVIKEKNLLDLTPHIEETLSSLRKVDDQYSEAFIYNKATGFYSLAQLKLDPYSSELFSTSAENFRAIQELQEQGVSLEEAIEKISHKEEQHD